MKKDKNYMKRLEEQRKGNNINSVTETHQNQLYQKKIIRVEVKLRAISKHKKENELVLRSKKKSTISAKVIEI